MPKQKDLKRIIRSRMRKTGESYTAAHLHIVRKKETTPDYATLAGVSDDALQKSTGRTWAEWVDTLDAVGAAEMPHRQIARHVLSLGTSSWWSQTVTVGYERIRGLRERGQLCTGEYEATKSRTFPVPVEELYKAFAEARLRARWLPARPKVKTAYPGKRIRVVWEDDTLVEFSFTAKGSNRSAVAIQHLKLTDKPAAEQMKLWWADRLRDLSEILA